MSEAGQVGAPLHGTAQLWLQGLVKGPVPRGQDLGRIVVVERAEVAARVLPPVVRDDGAPAVQLMSEVVEAVGKVGAHARIGIAEAEALVGDDPRDDRGMVAVACVTSDREDKRLLWYVPLVRLVWQPILLALAAGIGLVAARVRIGRGGALTAALVFVAIRGLLALLVGPILGQTTQEHIDYMVAKIPRGRTVEVQEIAALVAWAASADCSFTTGSVFDISGGRATY